jgi:hypothetical protein
MDPIDRTSLAQTGGACRAAVAASGMLRAGTRQEVRGRSVWVVTHKITEFCTSVERLAWAKARGCPWVERTCALVAAGGCLEVLVWAREHHCPWDSRTCTKAARHGHLTVLRWARQHGCPWVERICDLAAESGHLEVLQWARLNDYPWDQGTTHYAAMYGHLELLRWARAHGCPWFKHFCEASSQWHPETLAWVQAQPE